MTISDITSKTQSTQNEFQIKKKKKSIFHIFHRHEKIQSQVVVPNNVPLEVNQPRVQVEIIEDTTRKSHHHHFKHLRNEFSNVVANLQKMGTQNSYNCRHCRGRHCSNYCACSSNYNRPYFDNYGIFSNSFNNLSSSNYHHSSSNNHCGGFSSSDNFGSGFSNDHFGGGFSSSDFGGGFSSNDCGGGFSSNDCGISGGF